MPLDGAFTIEKGVPLPRRTGGPPCKYPLRQMEIGDSFLIPGLKKTTANSIWRSAKLAGIKVAMRVVDGGVRVWRVA